MNPIAIVGVVAALVAASAVADLVRPVPGTRVPGRALITTVATVMLTVGIGGAAGIAPVSFLFGVAVFVAPVLVLLDAAAVLRGADRFARWGISIVWGVVVFPVAFLVPLTIIRDCRSAECRFDDFGAALPLILTAAAFVLPAWLPGGVDEPSGVDRPSSGRAIAAIAALWISSAVWLAHLEGMIDSYIPTILISALVAPPTAAIGWLIVDRLRGASRPPLRSLGFGFLVGLTVALPGAVSVAFPWSAITGAAAGAVGALVFSATERGASTATRWGLTVFTVASVALLAPAVSGTGEGLIFAARAAVLIPPIVAVLAVGVFAIAVAVPVWVVVGRHAARERAPRKMIDRE